MIPTYNERDNIGRLINAITALNVPGHDLHVLVVDDKSPDGTGQIVEEIAMNQPRVKLMTRTTGRGRGSAGIAGFKAALADKADYIVEMDADFSHDPRYLPDLIAAADQGADVVIGSRFVKGGADEDRGLYRQVVTKLAGIYVRTLLQVRIRDVSSGYRLFKRHVLEAIDVETSVSTGPSIVLELLYKCAVKGMKMVEVPIVFIDRREGVTKLNFRTLAKTLLMVVKIRRMYART